jgi:hypothetical protein
MGEFIRLNPRFGRKTYVAASRYALVPQTETAKFNTDVVFSERETTAEFMETHRYSDVIYNRYIQYGILTEPHIHTEPEPNNTNEYVSSIFDNTEETRHVDTDSDEGEDTTPIFEEDETYSESDTENEN